MAGCVFASPLVIFIFQLNWASEDLLLTALESWREACIFDSKTIFSPLVVAGSTYCVSGSFKPPLFSLVGVLGWAEALTITDLTLLQLPYCVKYRCAPPCLSSSEL